MAATEAKKVSFCEGFLQSPQAPHYYSEQKHNCSRNLFNTLPYPQPTIPPFQTQPNFMTPIGKRRAPPLIDPAHIHHFSKTSTKR